MSGSTEEPDLRTEVLLYRSVETGTNGNESAGLNPIRYSQGQVLRNLAYEKY